MIEVRDILKVKGPKVWGVKSSQTVREAMEILVRENIGALLVFNAQGKIAGIVSERDIARTCYNHPQNFSLTAIGTIMTKKVIVGKPEDKIDYIMGIMTKNRVRHIPIVSGSQLEGLISIGDVVKAQLQKTEYENQYLKEYMFGGESTTSDR
ncbi:MAG: CBS domain-containing protein [Candidatus Omnitrophica bacterium]|nr:CBS domain-containing protein [Candidatus Omnitrophota bacterium]